MKGRTDVLAAGLMGFGGKDLYRRAKKVQQLGSTELIAAVDQRQFTISTAALLAQLPSQKQLAALALSTEEISALSKQIKTCKQQSIGVVFNPPPIPKEIIQHA